MKDGPQALRFCIDQAEPLPIRGLFRLDASLSLPLPSSPFLSPLPGLGSSLNPVDDQVEVSKECLENNAWKPTHLSIGKAVAIQPGNKQFDFG